MTSMSLPQDQPRWVRILTTILAMLLIAAVVLMTVFSLYFLFSRVYYSQRVFPGVRIDGIDLGGLDRTDAEARLSETLTYPETGSLLLTYGDQAWKARPVDVGVFIDYEGMADQALAVGRQGSVLDQLEEQIDSWYFGHPLPTIVLFDQVIGTYYLNGIAAQLDRPTVEAELEIEGLSVKHYPGQVGKDLDTATTLEAISGPVAMMLDAEIPLTINEKRPLVLDASFTAELAQELLTEPMVLEADDFDGLSIQPEELARMLRFEIQEETAKPGYQIGIDSEALKEILEPLSPELERSPENARFIFNDDTRQLDLLEPAVIGRRLDMERSITSITDTLNNGTHQAALVFDLEMPIVDDEVTAEGLGITEAVSVVSTYFSGSSPERIQNIEKASSAFHGLLIPPGGSLSMAEILGDISLDNGYAEALIIYGDKTINGVGGGVCQVSTTLFRTAFFGGYEILERHPHAYRVGYYEQGSGSPGPGLDATVFVPVVDFKFVNDTPYWLLSETYVYGTQLLWKFYSSSDGRQVDWSSKVSNKKDAPKPLYKENPDLSKGKLKQIDYEADGMDVVVYRTVSLGDDILHRDTIKTHYLPWRAIWEYGPGTDLPDDVEVEED